MKIYSSLLNKINNMNKLKIYGMNGNIFKNLFMSPYITLESEFNIDSPKRTICIGPLFSNTEK
jgi:hypothetical protein